MMMHPRLRFLLAFLLLLAGSFATYYYGMVDTPRRDQGSYLAERVIVETDWDWFWHSVSYSRTRFLHPGDYYLFRPIHMAVLALKDIFFRNNLFAMGAINIIMMAVTAFSLYVFASRLLKPALAFVVALLFMVQYAGLEIVAWGHISPYLLALAFFGFAMTALLEAGPDNKAALKKAGIFLLLGALVHEMVAVALVLAAPFLLFIRWRAGKQASIGGIPLGSYVLWVVAMPVLVYSGLDLFDYLYHGAPPLLSTANDSAYGETLGPFYAIFTVAGTAAVAFLAPVTVELAKGETGILAWNFESMRPVIMVAGAALSVAVLFGIYRCVRAAKTSNGSRLALAGLIGLLFFAGILLGVGIGRIYSRGESYFYEATYYYSITAYLFCLLIAIGLYRSSKADKNMMSLFLSRATIFAMVLLIAVNFAKTREALGRDWPEKKKFARMHLDLEEAMVGYSQRYCLAGSASLADVWLQLIEEHMCSKKNVRIPGYLVTSDDGSLWLAELETKPIGAFGEPKKAALVKLMPTLMLSRDRYEKPDIALTVHNKSHIFLVFGYRSLVDYLQIEIYGPLVRGMLVTAEGEIDIIKYTAHPYVNSTQRVEVRHGTDAIYLFVDGHLVAVTKNYDKQQGKVGLYFEEGGNIDQTFSDFVVADPAPLGTDPVEFKPVVKLLEKSEVAFPL